MIMKIDRTYKDYDAVTPEVGMLLFNGETFSDGIFTPKNADLSAWQEVTGDFKMNWETEHPIELPEGMAENN